MFEYVVIGSGFAFAAAVQPGPLQAFLLSSVARRGWKNTLPASFAPLISDGPIALLTLLVLNQVPASISRALQAAGGVFLIYLAWASYREWRDPPAARTETDGSAPRTLLQAVTVNILNPNPYLGWSLVLGPSFLAAWEHDPAFGVVLILSFYLTMVSVTACIIILFGTTTLLKPNLRRGLILGSAAILAALGVYQIIASALRA
jgi:threonine/homoserine/homoserine lactone efflux protein